MDNRSGDKAVRHADPAKETFYFSTRFSLGTLLVSPVHVRVEQLRPIVTAHRHSNVSYELHYCDSGHGTVTVDGSTHDVNPGTLYVTGPGVMHMQTSDESDPVIEYCLYLNCRRASRQPNDVLALFADTPFWIGVDDGMLSQLLRDLTNECRRPKLDYEEMTETMVRYCIVYLTRMYRSEASVHSQPAHVMTRDSFMPTLEDAFFYHYRTLTLDDLASLLNLSVRQTQRLLQSHFGKTFSQKLTEARMAAATQFLDNTQLSITEIAERVGFSSIEHFSAAFRRHMGCPPTAYRKGSASAGTVDTGSL